MKIECPNCHKAYSIPDERLPFGQEIAFPCKACEATIELDLRSKTPHGRVSAAGAGKGGSPKQSAKELPKGEALKKNILQSISDLPPMPQTVHKAREIISSPDSNFKDLAKVLETDAAIATKVLKMANSSYYGLSGEVSSIQHAAVIVGHKTIGDLMTVAGTSSLLGEVLEGYELEPGDLWRHSLAVAFGSRMIAETKNPGLADDAFAAGLIHDSGKLILDKYILERKEAFKEFMKDGDRDFLAAEREILGFDHSELVSEVCKSWHIPDTLSVAVRYHHYPSESGGNELAYIVHMADVIAITTGMGTGMDGTMYQIDDSVMKFLGLRHQNVSMIMAEVMASVAGISEQMNMN